MRRWTHDVSVAWLQERKTVLTATDIVNLLPEYKRYLKKDPGMLMPGFAALWAEKKSIGMMDTGSPSAAAARGHVMEPWAVESWNEQVPKKFYHWDDCIICNGGLGFSPDAMDMPADCFHVRLDVSNDSKFLLAAGEIICDAPREIMEIKCYETTRHMKSVIAGRMDHPEIMQVAMAFAVLPGLETARILWFSPDSPISMHFEKYERDDLADQLKLITDIHVAYLKQALLCDELSEVHAHLKAQCTEEQVWEEFVKENADDNGNIFKLK